MTKEKLKDLVQVVPRIPKNEITTSDGIKFTVKTNDIIELTEDQFNDLAATVLRRKSQYIIKSGVDIASLEADQVSEVLNKISEIIGDSQNPLEDNLIRMSSHISDEHALNTDLLKKRKWYRDSIDELYGDIVNVIKEANHVRKAKIKFSGYKNESLKVFTYTVVGVKINGDDGEVSIAFINDDTDLILAVTIV
jgi:hypothetical protein